MQILLTCDTSMFRSHNDVEERCISERPIFRGRDVRELSWFGSSNCPLSTYDTDRFDRVCYSTVSTKSFMQLVLSRHNNVLMLAYRRGRTSWVGVELLLRLQTTNAVFIAAVFIQNFDLGRILHFY